MIIFKNQNRTSIICSIVNQFHSLNRRSYTANWDAQLSTIPPTLTTSATASTAGLTRTVHPTAATITLASRPAILDSNGSGGPCPSSSYSAASPRALPARAEDE